MRIIIKVKYDCLKQPVYAVIKKGKEMSFGRNYIVNNIQECPRMGLPSGEGYHLCRDVCGQQSHAEVDAIKNADFDTTGAKLYLFGHTYACGPCEKAIKDAGIEELIIMEGVDGRLAKKRIT